jgi:hypothetical protein
MWSIRPPRLQRTHVRNGNQYGRQFLLLGLNLVISEHDYCVRRDMRTRSKRRDAP